MLTETELYDRYEELKKENERLKKDNEFLTNLKYAKVTETISASCTYLKCECLHCKQILENYSRLEKENGQLKKDIQSLALRSASIFKENEKLVTELELQQEAYNHLYVEKEKLISKGLRAEEQEKNTISFGWEKLGSYEGSDGNSSTNRLKVPGGWIVSTETENKKCCSEALVFVSDENWTWRIKK